MIFDSQLIGSRKFCPQMQSPHPVTEHGCESVTGPVRGPQLSDDVEVT